MALTLIEKTALAGFGLNEVLLKGQGVGVKGIKLLGKAAVRMAPYAGRAAVGAAGLGARGVVSGIAAIPPPVVAGAALGYTALETEQGQRLLEAAAEHGRQSRVLYERAQAEMASPGVPYGFPAMAAAAAVPVAKKAASKFNIAVKKGMAAVKKSTSNGKRGKLRSPRAALAMVSKVISAKKKKKKAPKSGIRRKIWGAIGRYV